MTVQSTEEAMEVLKEWRSYLIGIGRWVGFQLCKKKGTTTSKEVTDFMEDQGALSGYTGTYCWVGAVFNKSDLFEATGRMINRVRPGRNNHDHVVREWRLKPEAECPPFPSDRPGDL